MGSGDRRAQIALRDARDPDWRCEAFVLVEFSKLLRTYVRSRAITRGQGRELLDSAASLLPVLPSVAHSAAYEVAMEFGVPAYDARFIALARQLKTRVVTEDRQLLAAAPAWTIGLDRAQPSRSGLVIRSRQRVGRRSPGRASRARPAHR